MFKPCKEQKASEVRQCLEKAFAETNLGRKQSRIQREGEKRKREQEKEKEEQEKEKIEKENAAILASTSKVICQDFTWTKYNEHKTSNGIAGGGNGAGRWSGTCLPASAMATLKGMKLKYIKGDAVYKKNDFYKSDKHN